jgi:YggT family protein
MVLGDAIDTAEDFVVTLIWVYIALIIVYILTSWIPLPYTVWVNRIQRFLYDVVEPYLRLFRRFVPQLSLGGLGLDLSPILAIITLYVLLFVVGEGFDALR